MCAHQGTPTHTELFQENLFNHSDDNGKSEELENNTEIYPFIRERTKVL